jgi:sarcosine oxidase
VRNNARVRVAVVGAGINGLAAAAALGRGGHAVEVHEQFELDHDRGSSHGRSRIFRLSYHEPQWVQLAQEAHRGWRELEEETGEQLIDYTGLVELGETSEAALDACGVPWEGLEPDTVRMRFGVVADGRALLQPEAGISFADRARRAFWSVARAHGATLHERSRVAAPEALDADVVVVAAGGWAKELLAPSYELDTVITRETVCYFRLERSVPSVIDYGNGPGEQMYSLRDPKHGLKAGAHMSGAVVDPDEPGEPDPTIVEATVDWVRRRFPEADADPVAFDTCLYTSTPDHSFVLERLGRIVVASACSGHGFKFAPAVGARIAALAAG